MRITLKHFLLFVLAYFICGQAIAQGLFDVAPTDKSLKFLGIVFGGNVGAISLGGGANPLLSKMFERFNFIIVAVGVSILSYIGIAAAINTAREGEAMGKKFSLWVPLRAMLGMLLMVPSPGTGYSVVQMTVMWVVLNGVGAANQIWNVVLDQRAKEVPAVGTIEITVPPTIDNLTQTIFRSAVCMNSLNNLNPPLIQNFGPVKILTSKQPMNPPVPPTPNPASPTAISQTGLVEIGVEGSSPGDRRLCGSYEITTSISSADTQNAYNSASLDLRLTTKMDALIAMFNAIEPAAAQLSPPSNASSTDINKGYAQLAAEAFKARIVQLAGGARSRGTGASWERSAQGSNIQNEINQLKQNGWIHAGGYYFFLTQAGGNVDTDAVTIPEGSNVPLVTDSGVIANSNNGSQIVPSIWSKNLYDALFNNVNRTTFNNAIYNTINYSTADRSFTPPTLPTFSTAYPGTSAGWLDSIGRKFSDSIRKFFLDKFQQALRHPDPLLGMGDFGFSIMINSEAIILGYIATTGLLSLAVAGIPCVQFSTALAMAFLNLFWLIAGVVLAFWTCGAMLGIYIPLVPYIIFVTTAVGWFIAVFEAILGAPIIALSMIQPGGEELGGLKPGLHILANVFLRPMLMIFGFIAAGSILKAAITLVDEGFYAAITTAVPKTSFFGFIPVLAIYAFLLLALVNQAFGLIYEVPNKILRFMGASPEQFDPGRMLTEVKGGYEKGAEMGSKATGAPAKWAHSKSIGKEGYIKGRYDESRKPKEGD